MTDSDQVENSTFANVTVIKGESLLLNMRMGLECVIIYIIYEPHVGPQEIFNNKTDLSDLYMRYVHALRSGSYKLNYRTTSIVPIGNEPGRWQQ